jgi:hypothetical protein
VSQNNCHCVDEKKKVARKMTSLYLTTFSNKKTTWRKHGYLNYYLCCFN